MNRENLKTSICHALTITTLVVILWNIMKSVQKFRIQSPHKSEEKIESYIKNSGTKEFSNEGTFDLSKVTSVGNIQMVKPNMEVNFEIRIYNWDSYPTDGFIYLLFIQPWLHFSIRKSSESSKFYITHT